MGIVWKQEVDRIDVEKAQNDKIIPDNWIKLVAYSSQGSHAGQTDFWNWQTDYNDWIMWLELLSVKSNNVYFLNQIRYSSVKQLPNCPHEAGWPNQHLKLWKCLESNSRPHGQ